MFMVTYITYSMFTVTYITYGLFMATYTHRLRVTASDEDEASREVNFPTIYRPDITIMVDWA